MTASLPSVSGDDTTVLTVEDLDVFYGHMQALHAVSLRVHQNETVALIGANGAGKSTLLSTLAGAKLPRRGTVRWEGNDVTHVPDHRRVRMGISLTPEGRRLFTSLTVEENLQVGSRAKRPGDWTLERLSGREAVFARADERRRIELPVAHGGPADAAAPLPVPARAPAAARPVPPPANVAAPPTPARAAPPAAATAADTPDGRPRAAFGGSADPRPRASAPR